MSRTVVLTATLVLALVAACMAASVVVVVKPAEAAFPGRNGDIAFVSEQLSPFCCPLQVFKMDPAGQTSTQLTSSPGYQLNYNPDWSPDGTKIAFSSTRDGNTEIYVMDANGNNQTNLTNNSADDFWPAWFPDGRRIAFASNREGNVELYVMPLDESGRPIEATRLTNNPAADWMPAVSPGGQKIAFVGERDGDQEIYVIKSAPEGPENPARQRTFNRRYDAFPNWSPDGTKLVWAILRHATGWDIRVMNSRGGGGKTDLTTVEAHDMDPAFSPDGQYIVFDSNRDGTSDIWRMRTDGTEATNLTPNSSGFDTDPDWQPLPMP
jgi:Tol biopolymer transport system component